MSIRDKIMDKYWMDFLNDKVYLVGVVNQSIESLFWMWFYKSIHSKLVPKTHKLEDYLK